MARIAPSAFKHGINADDIAHALDHAMWRFEQDDLAIVVGGDRAGRLIEVGLISADDGTNVVIHAMPARRKYLRR